MSEQDPVTMKVTLVDGSHRTFLFDHRRDGRLTIATRLEQLLSDQSVAIRLPDKLLVIPVVQIKAVEFTPSPSVNLEQVIGPAREVQANGESTQANLAAAHAAL